MVRLIALNLFDTISPFSIGSHKPLSKREMPLQQILKFPKDFMWGVATSAHQIEGAFHDGSHG
jgi:hypothetical protein